MRRVLRFVLGASVVLSGFGQANSPPAELVSPDRQSRIRLIASALPGSDPTEGFFTIVVEAHDKVIQQCPTMGYLTNAMWSPDYRYVAVNNRRGNSGDYLWVFSLADGAVPQAPNDAFGLVFADRACRKLPELSIDDFDTFVNTAKGWTGPNQLTTETRLTFHQLRGAIILRTGTYEANTGGLKLKTEEFQKIAWPPK